MKKSIVLIVSIVLLNSCASFFPKQTAEKLPVQYIIHNDSEIIDFPVPYSPDGYDKEEVDRILTNYLYPMVFQTKTDEDGETEVEFDGEFISDSVKVYGIQRSGTLSLRNYYLAEGSTGFTVPGLGSADAKYNSMFELNLTMLNPQFKLRYLLFNVEELFRLYLQDQVQNTVSYVMFTREVFAPEMFYEYFFTEGDAQFSAKTPIIHGSGKGVVSQTATRNYSNRFTVRKYADHNQAIKTLSGGSGMFFEIDASLTDGYRQFSSSVDDIIAPSKLLFEYQGKYYILTEDYADHLRKERVSFMILDPEENTNFKTADEIASMSAEGFSTWLHRAIETNPELVETTMGALNLQNVKPLIQFSVPREDFYGDQNENQPAGNILPSAEFLEKLNFQTTVTIPDNIDINLLQRQFAQSLRTIPE